MKLIITRLRFTFYSTFPRAYVVIVIMNPNKMMTKDHIKWPDHNYKRVSNCSYVSETHLLRIQVHPFHSIARHATSIPSRNEMKRNENSFLYRFYELNKQPLTFQHKLIFYYNNGCWWWRRTLFLFFGFLLTEQTASCFCSRSSRKNRRSCLGR